MTGTDNQVLYEKFVDAIKGVERLIKYIINRSPFIFNEDDRKDCYQEILIAAWLSFPRYDQLRPYKAWVRTDIKFGIRRFVQNMIKRKSRYKLFDDFSNFDIAEEEDYNEHLYDSLKVALQSLDYKERDRVLSVFSDSHLYEQWQDPRKRGSKLREEIFYTIEKIKANRHAWSISGIGKFKNSNSCSGHGEFFESTAIARPVEQLDTEGSFIKLWPSARSASVYFNCNYRNIHLVCEGQRQSAGGYRWRYQGEERREILNRQKGKGGAQPKMIDQLDLQGNIIKTWPSMSEACRAGFTPSLIRKTINGKVNQHGGYKWKYHAN